MLSVALGVMDLLQVEVVTGWRGRGSTNQNAAYLCWVLEVTETQRGVGPQTLWSGGRGGGERGEASW